MRVRIRFVITLTLVVSAILAISFLIIYTLYSKNRETDFNNRLWANAYNAYKKQYHITDIDKALNSKLEYYLPGSPANFHSIIIDSAFHIVSINPNNINYSVDTNRLLSIKDAKEIYFSQDPLQGV